MLMAYKAVGEAMNVAAYLVEVLIFSDTCEIQTTEIRVLIIKRKGKSSSP